MKQASLLLLLLQAVVVVAHTRLECPPPRSGETGAKVGPCDAPDDADALPAYPLIPNALNTVTWLESISHPGAPARFALSLENSDEGFESCILLDHVPHDEHSRPQMNDPLTFHRASITLFIPDIYCERCHLQLMTVMSDEIHGVPPNSTCFYKGAMDAGTVVTTEDDNVCPVVYHSCAPVSINGTIPRNDISTCNTVELEQQLDWPFTMAQQQKEYSTYYYKGDPGLYNQTNHRLLSGGAPVQSCSNFGFCDPDIFFKEIVAVPDTARYSTLAGSCAAMVGMPVQDFALGQLPFSLDLVEVDGIMDNHPADCDSVTCTQVADCFTTWCKDGDSDEVIDTNSSNRGDNKTSRPTECMAPVVTTCEHCYPESPCSSAMTTPGIVLSDDPPEDSKGAATEEIKSDASFHVTRVTKWSFLSLVGVLLCLVTS